MPTAADIQLSYNLASRRIRRALVSGAAVYVVIAENVARRWSEHAPLWDRLDVLVEARTSETTAQLERQLLSEFGGHHLCQNAGLGGESASSGSPHFLYMVVPHNGLIRRPGR